MSANIYSMKATEPPSLLLLFNLLPLPRPLGVAASSQKSFGVATYPKQTPSVTLPIMNEREHNAHVSLMNCISETEDERLQLFVNLVKIFELTIS